MGGRKRKQSVSRVVVNATHNMRSTVTRTNDSDNFKRFNLEMVFDFQSFTKIDEENSILI